MKRPRSIHIETKVAEILEDPDVLSLGTIVYRNGGHETIVFAEVTPELLAWLQEQTYE